MLVELNEIQADTIIKALDFIGRLQLGQIKELEVPFSHRDKSDITYEIETIKNKIFPELSHNEFYGIGHKDQVPESARIGYDIIQVLRHKMAFDKNPEGGYTVDFSIPMQFSTEPLPKIKGD